MNPDSELSRKLPYVAPGMFCPGAPVLGTVEAHGVSVSGATRDLNIVLKPSVKLSREASIGVGSATHCANGLAPPGGAGSIMAVIGSPTVPTRGPELVIGREV